MSLKFNNTIAPPCNVPTPRDCPAPPSVEVRCDDPVFRAQHPELCVGFARLIVKPGNLIMCSPQSTTFKAFLVSDGMAEQEITSGVTWMTSDRSVVQVSVAHGTATSVGMGMASVTAHWQGKVGAAEVIVLPECCDNTRVGIALVIDNSQSMNQAFAGTHGGTKLSYVKKLANDYVGALNLGKDLASINVFSLSGAVALDFSDDVADLKASIAGIGMTNNPTDIADAIADAAASLNSRSDLDLRVIVLFSDGYQTVTANPVPAADLFRSQGGFILAVGIRAAGQAYDLLSQVANAGFFINAHILSEASIANWLGGLSGYFCSGNCQPKGDVVVVGRAQLNFSAFTNWDVWSVNNTTGLVDIIGGHELSPEYTLFDVLPGNGLYVDLRGTSGLGGLRSKTAIEMTAGNKYHVTLRLAGNNRNPNQHDSVRVAFEQFGGIQESETIGPIAPMQDFEEYTFTYTPEHSGDGKFRIDQLPHSSAGDSIHWPDTGTLLDLIKIEEEWLSTDGHFDTIVDDDFDSENGGYIAPECPENLIAMPDRWSPTLGTYGYGYACDGYGCLLEPVPAQLPDPFPLPTVDEGGVLQSPVIETSSGFNPAGQFVTVQGLLAILSNYFTAAQVQAMLAGYATHGDVEEAIRGAGGLPGPDTTHWGEDADGNWIPDIEDDHAIGSLELTLKGFYAEKVAVHEGELVLQNPDEELDTLFHTITLQEFQGTVMISVDQTGSEISGAPTVGDSGVEHWEEDDNDDWVPDLPNEHNLGTPTRLVKAIYAEHVSVLAGKLYLKYPDEDDWYEISLTEFQGIMHLDVDQTPVTITPGSGGNFVTREHWVEDTAGNWVPDMASMFSVGREDRRILSLYTGGPVIWNGDLYLKLGSAYHKLVLAEQEGVVVLGVGQTATAIT